MGGRVGLNPPTLPERDVLAAATCTYDLRLSFVAVRSLIGERGQDFCAFEHLWVANTIGFVAIAGAFFSESPRRVTPAHRRRTKRARRISVVGEFASSCVLGLDTQIADNAYRERLQTGVRECAADPVTVAHQLLERLLVSFRLPGQVPFGTQFQPTGSHS